MEVEGLLDSNLPQENGGNSHYCNGRCGSITQVKPLQVQPAPCTNKRCRTCSTATYDSGFSVSLDTISEHQGQCRQGFGEPCLEISNNNKRDSINDVPCTGSLHCSCHVPAPKCEESLRRCQNHGHVEFSASGNCLYSAKSHMKGVRTSRSSGDFQTVNKQNAQCKHDRRRTVSESCAGNYNLDLSHHVFDGSQNSDDYSQKDVESTCSTEKAGCCRRSCCKIATVIAILFLLAGIGTGFYFVTKNMHNEIESLKDAVGKHKTAPASLSYMTSPEDESTVARPRVHMSLSGDEQTLHKWDQQILQWNPRLKERDGFGYNNSSRCLIVKEEGVYFVYNQIYVFRTVAAKSADVSQHTIFHTIWKKPHNSPSELKPLMIAESALSHCWNEEAQNQIHTSYQGIIVSLQQNDQLFIGLDGLDDSDILETKSTFFGAFKL